MKTKIIAALLFFAGVDSYPQSELNHYIGLNLLQLPNSTINANYSIDYKPYLTLVIDLGYTINYNYKYDIGGYYISSHNDFEDGYTLTKQSGGYLKIGGFLNFRRDFESETSFILEYFLLTPLFMRRALIKTLIQIFLTLLLITWNTPFS